MRKILIFISFLLITASGKAQTGDELMQLVDSAYAEAMHGRIPKAIRINEVGLTLVPADSLELQCEFYSCLLYCYHRLGDYEKALYYGELCLSYDEAQGDPANISVSLGNLAGIYSSAGKHDVAIRYLNRAIDIEEELVKNDASHTKKSLAVRKAMLGEVLVAKAITLGEEDRRPLLLQALELTNEAYLIDKQLDRKAQMGMRLSQLGNIYQQLGDEDEARRCNEEALAIAHETNNRATEVITLLQLGRYREAADLAKTLGMKRQEMQACSNLAQEAKNKGDYEEATRYLERFSELRDIIQTEDSERQLTMWEVRYETQQKEQQLLMQAQTIKAQRQRLVWLIVITIFTVLVIVLLAMQIRIQLQLAKTKSRNYTILTHDLKNPMVAQQQMLRLFYNNYENYSHDEIQMNIGRLLSSSDEQLDLLYNLQQMALLENGKKKIVPVRIDLSSIVNDVVANIRSYADLKHVSFTLSVRRCLVMADRDTLRTVVRNILSNAVKFSYDGGIVEIGITDDNEGLYVRDHGVGMSDERVHELMTAKHAVTSQTGTKGEGGTGIGMLLCRELVHRNKGIMKVKSEPLKGTTFTVILPKSV
jgi:signal transduction histidine kinase